MKEQRAIELVQENLIKAITKSLSLGLQKVGNANALFAEGLPGSDFPYLEAIVSLNSAKVMLESLKGLTDPKDTMANKNSIAHFQKPSEQTPEQSSLPKFSQIFAPLMQELQEQITAYKQVAHPDPASGPK